MFQVADERLRLLWAPLDTTATPTLYVGQLVYSTGDGVNAMPVAAGAADVTNKNVPLGIVVGEDNRTPQYSTTQLANKIVAVATQAAQAARDYTGVEGISWIKQDPQAFVQIALIDPNTIIKANLFKGAIGTAPTVLTVTTGSAAGTSFTSNATDFTPVANICSSYCRTGANKGLVRISSDVSTTVEANTVAFPSAIAVGDTFIRVPMRPIGKSFVQIDSTASYIDVSQSPATNYFVIHVIGLDLRVAGQEYVYFRFDACHFDSRA